jgi:hypothetical protein
MSDEIGSALKTYTLVAFLSQGGFIRTSQINLPSCRLSLLRLKKSISKVLHILRKIRKRSLRYSSNYFVTLLRRATLQERSILVFARRVNRKLQSIQ